MFRKPRRNFRQRLSHSDDEDKRGVEDSMDIDEDSMNPASPPIEKAKKKKEKKEKPAKKNTLLSFGEELEGDDGEVFQVKKSSQSRKLKKLMEKEKKKKERAVEIAEATGDAPAKAADVFPGLDIKVIEKHDKREGMILAGKDAETVHTQSDDEIEEEEEDQPKKHVYDPIRRVLEVGVIPDAAMIHAARKRRQLAREQGNDFIPITNNDRESKSRLVREDDQDRSDEDEDSRIDFRVSLAAADRESRMEKFREAEETGNKEEVEDWEAQQISKVFSGGKQLSTSADMEMSSSPPPPSSQPVSSMPPDTYDAKDFTLEAVTKRLQERLTSVKEVNRRHQMDLEKAVSDYTSTQQDMENSKSSGPSTSRRYRFYQELREYMLDYIECYDQKMARIERLEETTMNLIKARNQRLVQRRRQDIKDQSDEFSQLSKKSVSGINLYGLSLVGADVAERTRRAAEREGRRTRRRKAREVAGRAQGHQEGMSSDDEETESELTVFNRNWEQVEVQGQATLEDVIDDFNSLRTILSKFERWKQSETASYNDAYVSLCLPKVLSPLIRLQMLTWNPFKESDLDIENMEWFSKLLLYGFQDNETESSFRRDPDCKLVSLTVEKVVLPRLTAIVEKCWDPLSTSETLRLVRTVSRYSDEYPTVNGSSKQLQQLLQAVVRKLGESLDNDVFLPLYPVQVLETKPPALAFFQRQFWVAVKLLRNLISWHGLLADGILRELALDGLLNRYLLLPLHNSLSLQDSIFKCRMIVLTMPRAWLQSKEPLPQLQRLVRFVNTLGDKIDQEPVINRDFVKEVANMLKTLGAKRESESILKRFL